jgi:polyphosphate kinase
MTAPSSASPPTHHEHGWLNRDLSLLAFNARVLDWAQRDDVPLLERLRYLCIVSSNLDEFFEVRGALHLGKPAPAPGAHAERRSLSRLAHELVERQYGIFNDVLSPEFGRHGVRVVSYGERTAAQHRWVRALFERDVRLMLLPIVLDPAHPLPQVANKSLNFIVKLAGTDAFGRLNEIAIVKVPRVLPRLIRIPQRLSGEQALFVSISSVIRAHLQDLFPRREVVNFSQFRVTRHSDLAVDEDEVKNLRMALREGLMQRHYGQAVRLEVSAACQESLSDLLLKQFHLTPASLYRVPGPVNLVRMSQLIALLDKPKWLFPSYQPRYPVQLRRETSIFERLQRGDVLIHLPYESFEGVTDFLREAVTDPDVLAIKQTFYRTGSDRVGMDLMRLAVQSGKEVTAGVELKARFDEEANINWAEQLEHIGVQVVYGVVGLKTHAKMLLVSRREGRQIRLYGHLSTGNYNPSTARLYTDICHLTADPQLTHDIEQTFGLLANQSPVRRLHKCWLAPFNLQRKLIEQVHRVAQRAHAGEKGRIVLKMNTLTDEPLMQALVDAGRAGVEIDLIVRGACMLPAQRPGFSERIRVRSVIGRFLEHSRVFYFRAGDDEWLYLSSADWMNRNMLRRVELAWPVEDPQLRQRLIDECLVAYLYDQRDAWQMHSDGHYHPVASAQARQQPGYAHLPGAQNALMARYSGPFAELPDGSDPVASR